MPVVASATLEVTPVLAGAQQSLTQQLTGAAVDAGDKAGAESGNKFAGSMAKKIAVGSVAVAGAVAGVGAALVGTASKTAAYGDSIDKASQKLGVSSTFYQEWEAVLQHSGTSMDKMGGTFKRLATASQAAFHIAGSFPCPLCRCASCMCISWRAIRKALAPSGTCAIFRPL